ncbi:hypothetical protein JOF56_010315 [Kibdelosporangium banguiense]|uniref:Uncharacterized protein n=1 Tax=Kibdelosporangium banguiense TaxID=1365924 RepID=A0ABS4U157_9PSEU|nr:hypothetical protein [Kibdelosporangium banguiense]
MSHTQTREEEAVEVQNEDLPSPREAEEFEFEPTIVRGRE